MRLQPLKVTDVVSVYEGEVGKCCCGCAGEYYYSPAFTELIAEYVGEHLICQPRPEQFNQEKITVITELVNKHIEEQHGVRILYGNDGVTHSLGGGFYVLELNGLKYHVRTTAEYEMNRRIKKELAAKNTQQPTETGASNDEILSCR